jgi:chromosome segregation ATPase
MAADDGFSLTLNARRQTLTAQALRATAADRRIAELECELDQAREQLTHQQNRAASLETSFALKADENSRLSARVAALSADLKRKHDELESCRLALATVEAERISLEKSVALKADEKSHLSHRITELSADLDIKHDQLERARLALAAAQSERIKALDRSEAERSARDRDVALVSARAERAEKLLEQIRQQLRASESEIERLRSEQVKTAGELARRASAVAAAERTITSLGTLFWQLESAVRRQEQDPPEPEVATQGIVAERAGGGSIASGILQRDLGADAWLFETLRNGRA